MGDREEPRSVGYASGETGSAGVGSEGIVANDAVVTQAEIDDILNDEHMPIEERTRRLQELADRAGVSPEEDGTTDPLMIQINEALGFLASGGHDYGDADPAADEASSIVDKPPRRD